MWYDCYIVLLCDLSSISRKAIGCGKIRNAPLVSKRSKRYGRILTIWIAVQTFPNNSGIGWVKGELYSVIFEVREDAEGEYHHLITLWKATKEEQKLYDENS